MASEEERDLYNEIIARGCCRSCALRYLGHSRTLITFDYPNTSLVNFGLLSPLEEFEIEPHGKMKKSNPCTVCLGVLQESTIEELLANENLAKTSEYSHETFVAYITFPSCVLIRDHSMKLHLKKTFPYFDASNVIKINNAWRYSVEKRLSKILNKQYNSSSKFIVHFYTEYSLENDEMALIQDLVKSNVFQYPISKHQVTAILDSTSDEQFSKFVNVPPREPFYGVVLKDVKFSSEPIHIMGNYCKYSRKLPQVPINNDGEQSIETIILEAVRDCAGPFKEIIFKASNFDYLETRILGSGRTFHLQLNDPKFEVLSREQLKKIEDTVRKSKVMEVKNLHHAEKRDIGVALDSEQLSPCSFKMLCIVYQCKNIDYCINAVNMYKTVDVLQRTPIRLIHKRELKKRKIKIYYIRAKKIRDNLIEVDLCVQCGLCIFEFVHGELGRTRPSLCDIMKAKVEILAVDLVDFRSTLACAAEEEEVVI